jgi:hypothetical protein
MLPAGEKAFLLIGGSNLRGRVTQVERITVP